MEPEEKSARSSFGGSGTLITARLAFELGQDVYALPWRADRVALRWPPVTERETGKIDLELRGWQQDAQPSDHRAVLLRTTRAKDPEEATRELEAQGIQTESAGRRLIVAIVTPELLDRAAAHAWVRAIQQPQEYKPMDLLG